MLQHLHIKNFTLIDEIDIRFNSGFSVITGETGAGKSILLGALSLVLGKRAEASLHRDPSRKCVIEAQFNVCQMPLLQAYFEQEDLDFEEICLLRRELLPSGKSRAFVNDTPVTLEVMSSVGAFLIDIHSQHQTLEIFNGSYQLHLIDGIAKNQVILKSYQLQYDAFQKLSSELEALEQSHASALKDWDYNQFLLEELQKCKLQDGIQEELEEKQLQLANASEIIEKTSHVLSILEGTPNGVLEQLQDIGVQLNKLSHYGGTYKDLKDRLNGVHIELSDISETLSVSLESQEVDPNTLELVNEHLQLIYSLQRKHSAANVSDLIDIKEALMSKGDFVSEGSHKIDSLRKSLDEAENLLHAIASELHKSRLGVLPEFSNALLIKLAALGMPKAEIKIELNKVASFGPLGTDQVNFLFSANPGQTFAPLKKVASGGEMSRIMLSIKALISKYVSLPTIIFDEIDTGVSGEIATKMGDIMKAMGHDLQLIAISHLPQVASKGQMHYKVFKDDDGQQTQTQLCLLDPTQRISEIAEMLGGKEMSDSAIAHAKQLLA